jgi:hypothetical protein
MSQQIEAIWNKFDTAAAAATSPDMKALIEAMKAQTELLNLRLFGIEYSLENIMQEAAKIVGKSD